MRGARQLSRLRLRRVALSVAITVVVALAFVLTATGSASTKPTHFAGFPEEGVKASMPTTGRLLIGLGPTDTTTWNVYADGRVIWQKWTSSGDATVVPDGARRLDTGYVQQRLTPQGVQLLLSKILATGLFEQDLTLDLGSGHAWAHHQVRRGDRIVTVISTPSPNPADPRVFTKATPAQMRGLAWIEKFVANPARWLPASTWANRQIRAFVPARYFPSVSIGPIPTSRNCHLQPARCSSSTSSSSATRARS